MTGPQWVPHGAPYMLRAVDAGLATLTGAALTNEGQPTIALGGMFAELGIPNGPGDIRQGPPVPIIVLADLAVAGRVIAAVEEFATRHGIRLALDAAVDQARAWARQTPASDPEPGTVHTITGGPARYPYARMTWDPLPGQRAHVVLKTSDGMPMLCGQIPHEWLTNVTGSGHTADVMLSDAMNCDHLPPPAIGDGS